MKLPPPAPPRLRLVPAGRPDPALLDWLGIELERQLGTSVRREDPLPLEDEWRNPERDQYCSNPIVDALADRFAEDAGAGAPEWTLAVTEADLYAPGREFVFGEATLGGCCAVVSTARLGCVPEVQPADLSLLRLRLLKEAVHELGHVAGLSHCDDASCVMAESYDMADTDRKGSAFCPVCSVLARRGAPAHRA